MHGDAGLVKWFVWLIRIPGGALCVGRSIGTKHNHIRKGFFGKQIGVYLGPLIVWG